MTKSQRKSRKKKKQEDMQQQYEVKAQALQVKAADVEQMLRKFDWRTHLLEQRLVQTRLSLHFHAKACGHTSIVVINDTFLNIRKDIPAKIAITPELIEELIHGTLYPKLCQFIEPLIVMETNALNVGAQCKAYLKRAGMRVAGTPIPIIGKYSKLFDEHGFHEMRYRFGMLEFTPDKFDAQMCYRHAKAIGECYGHRDIVFQYSKPPIDVVTF